MVFIQVEAWLHASERMRLVKNHWSEGHSAGCREKPQGSKTKVGGVGTWFHVSRWIMTLVWHWNFAKELFCT